MDGDGWRRTPRWREKLFWRRRIAWRGVGDVLGCGVLCMLEISLLPVLVMGDSVSRRGEEEAKELVGVEAELHRWFRVEGASEEGSRKAVALLNSDYLLAQPRPRRWNRRGEFGHAERCRYLWYRHAAKILGWCERHQFPDFIRNLLREQYYPATTGERHEETRTSEDGDQVAGHGKRHKDTGDDRDNDQRGPGESIQSSFCIFRLR